MEVLVFEAGGGVLDMSGPNWVCMELRELIFAISFRACGLVLQFRMRSKPFLAFGAQTAVL